MSTSLWFIEEDHPGYSAGGRRVRVHPDAAPIAKGSQTDRKSCASYPRGKACRPEVKSSRSSLNARHVPPTRIMSFCSRKQTRDLRTHGRTRSQSRGTCIVVCTPQKPLPSYSLDNSWFLVDENMVFSRVPGERAHYPSRHGVRVGVQGLVDACVFWSKHRSAWPHAGTATLGGRPRSAEDTSTKHQQIHLIDWRDLVGGTTNSSRRRKIWYQSQEVTGESQWPSSIRKAGENFKESKSEHASKARY